MIPKSYVIECYRQARQTLIRNTNDRVDVPAIAKLLGKSVQWVYRVADGIGLLKGDHYNHLPVEDAGYLAMESGDTSLLEWMLEQCGKVCIDIPAGEAGVKSEAVLEAAAVLKESAEAASTWIGAMADGKLSEEERVSVQKECYEAMKAMAVIYWYCRDGKDA